MTDTNNSGSSSRNPPSAEKPKMVSGFLIFVADGKTYKGEIIKVNNFCFADPLFSGEIEGVVEVAHYQDK